MCCSPGDALATSTNTADVWGFRGWGRVAGIRHGGPVQDRRAAETVTKGKPSGAVDHCEIGQGFTRETTGKMLFLFEIKALLTFGLSR